MSGVEVHIDARDWTRLVALSMLWGGTFFFTGFALREVPPLTLVFVRLSLAALILLPLVLAQNITLPSGLTGWRPFALMALINNVIPFSLQVVAQVYIPSGMASVVNATTPVFTVLVLAAFGDEKLVVRRVIAVVVGLIGVAVLHGQAVDVTSRQSIGILLCLAATVSYGFSALWAKRKLTKTPPLATATFQLICSSLMMSVLSLTIDRPWELPFPSLATCAAIVGLASLSTALAFIIFFQIVVRSGASNVMLVTLLVPVSAILLGYFFLGERLEVREIIGALIIGSALLVMDGRIFRVFNRSART